MTDVRVFVIRVLVIDDERLARLGVTARLQRHSDILVQGECATGEEAIPAIERLGPDLVFLDVQMPGLSGLEVLRALQGKFMPRVIFLTAYDDYALEAFEAEAIDYLLKPIDEGRFEAALSRARRVLRLDRHEDLCGMLETSLSLESPHPASLKRPLIDSPSPQLRRFAIRRGREVSFVELAEVDWIEGLGDYAGLHVNGRTHLVRETLTSLALRLDSHHFLRIHRSTIVRVDRIIRVDSLANRDYLITLSDQSKLRSSRTYSDALRPLLQNKAMPLA